MAHSSISMPTTVVSERPKAIHLTRYGILSFVLILIGFLIFNDQHVLTPGTTSVFTWGGELDPITVETIPVETVMGLFYMAVGILGVLPLGFFVPENILHSVKRILLIIAAVSLLPTLLVVVAAGSSMNMTVVLQVSFRLATPIVMGALAGIWCERAGVTNIAIEGMMLTGACFGFVAFSMTMNTLPTGSAQLLGVLIAILSGGIIALLHGWLSITFKTNQIVSGTVLNILAVGVTSFLRREVLLSSDAGRATLQPINLPILSDIPVVGSVLFSGKPIFYSMLILIVVTHIVLFYTRWGLRTRAVGENPRAADTLGINVNRTRWINVFIGGLIAGLAGAWFSLETNGSFDDNMTSGRGFIGLAAVVFGKWLPFGAFGGGLLFGFSDAFGQRLQFLTRGEGIPAQFLQMVPYIVTIVVLAGLIGRAVAPKAVGIPYEKEGK